MSTEREREALCEIEKRLSAEDPRLAAFMARDMSTSSFRTRKRIQDLILVLAALLATLCIALSEPAAGLAAGLFAGAVFAIRHLRGRTRGFRTRRWRASDEP
jgi:hypothetical protein